MNTQGIKDFVGRDWAALQASKRAHWTAVFQQEGWRPVWNAAQALLLHARRVQKGFPTERDRDVDFAHHLALRSRLDRAAHAFARR